ncbi:hypothetical protein [Actinoplanes solisilvae]|uniref:hypothetical protein n=1 Tax=Actinoplanes solisilvae TaxID=2486853 RepID=UPI000FD927B2|nr:hypothetical protein [Actinoplanes solisilvae]
MSPAVLVLLLLAGFSEAAGRVLPIVAGRRGASRTVAISLVLAGTAIEAATIALWPLFAWTLAELLPGTRLGTRAPDWTPGLLAPLLLAAVLAFPLLGPLLHGLLLVGVGAGLAGVLAPAAGIGWWTAAGCVAGAGVGLAVAVEAVRRLVIRLHPHRVREAVAP